MSESSERSMLYGHPDALIAVDPPDNRVRAIFPVDVRVVGGDGCSYIASSPTLYFNVGQSAPMIGHRDSDDIQLMQDAIEDFVSIFSANADLHFCAHGNLDRYLPEETWARSTFETARVAALIEELRQRIHRDLYQTSVEISFVPGRKDDIHLIRADNIDPTGVAIRRAAHEMS